jgi:hypothetical protein
MLDEVAWDQSFVIAVVLDQVLQLGIDGSHGGVQPLGRSTHVRMELLLASAT